MSADAEQLLAEAERLRELFYAESDRVEAARRVPEDLSAMMAAAGFYRLGVPAEYGGLEAPPAVSSQIFETLARGDASCGWIAFIAATSGTSLSDVPAAAAAEVFSSPTTHIAGVFAPTGTAERTESGFVVNGRWQWGSGTQNADWILGGCRLMQDGEPLLDDRGAPRTHMMLMPADAVEFIDTWHVSGLRGTGSLDYEVRDLFVPAERAVGFVPGERAAGALFAFPNITFLSLGIGAVCLGIARAAVDDLVQLARAKKRAGASRSIAELPHTHMQVAAAEAKLRSARLFYYDSIDRAWEAAEQGQKVHIEYRRDMRLATTHAVNVCVEVVDAMYTLAGGTSVYETSRLQRHFRDIHVATQHVMVGQHTLETAGRLFLGVGSKTVMF